MRPDEAAAQKLVPDRTVTSLLLGKCATTGHLALQSNLHKGNTSSKSTACSTGPKSGHLFLVPARRVFLLMPFVFNNLWLMLLSAFSSHLVKICAWAAVCQPHDMLRFMTAKKCSLLRACKPPARCL